MCSYGALHFSRRRGFLEGSGPRINTESVSPSGGGVLSRPVVLMRRGPVTSVEWCPFESSMLGTTSSDGQVAVWDLALERDPEEEAALAAHMNAASPDDLPPQLLFVHLGQVCARRSTRSLYECVVRHSV